MKYFTQQIISLVVLSVLLVGAQAIWAWTEPTVAPPGGNVAPPINTSTYSQTKEGALVVNNSAGATIGLFVRGGRIEVGDRAGATVTSTVGLGIFGKKLRIVDGTEGDGKVLASNANGLASWRDIGVNTKCPTLPSMCTTLPDGSVIQWGAMSVASASQPVTVNLWVPYAAATYNVQITSSSYGQNCQAALKSRSSNYFTFQTDATCSNETFYWQAVGR